MVLPRLRFDGKVFKILFGKCYSNVIIFNNVKGKTIENIYIKPFLPMIVLLKC